MIVAIAELSRMTVERAFIIEALGASLVILGVTLLTGLLAGVGAATLIGLVCGAAIGWHLGGSLFIGSAKRRVRPVRASAGSTPSVRGSRR